MVDTSVCLVFIPFVACDTSDLLLFFHDVFKVEAVCFLISAVANEIDCEDESVVPPELVGTIVKYSFSEETGVVVIVRLSWGVELPSSTWFPFVMEEAVVICEILDACSGIKHFLLSTHMSV